MKTLTGKRIGIWVVILMITCLMLTAFPVNTVYAAEDDDLIIELDPEPEQWPEPTTDPTLTLMRGTEVVNTISKPSGTVIVLPTAPNEVGTTCLGWSKTPGKTTNADYLAGNRYTITKDETLYAVMFKCSTEPLLNRLTSVNPHQYAQVYILGDSRTYHMKTILDRACGTDYRKNVTFICKSGSALSWLKDTGYPNLLKKIKALRKKDARPVAVIFNHGINNLWAKRNNAYSVAKDYTAFMNKVYKELKRYNVCFFYESVNPVNSAISPRKSERMVIQFNTYLQKNLKGKYTWINTYRYLIRNGYTHQSTFSLLRDKPYRDDGVHYSYRTQKRLFDYLMRAIR